ncbi:hypothetical protein GCM10009636_21520 [Arthrobacter koreensis]
MNWPDARRPRDTSRAAMLGRCFGFLTGHSPTAAENSPALFSRQSDSTRFPPAGGHRLWLFTGPAGTLKGTGITASA